MPKQTANRFHDWNATWAFGLERYNELNLEDEPKARNTLALHAMQGYIQYLGWDPDGYLEGKDTPNKVLISRSAYAIADAMLEEARKIK
jgi:hypothetical protein